MCMFGFTVGDGQLKNDPIPNTVRKCRSVIGAVSLMRSFIPDLATLLRPLVDAVKEGLRSSFKWTWECQDSFQKIKEILITEPVLQTFDEDKRMHVVSDRGKIGIACVLLQKGKDGYLKPVACTSKLLTFPQRFWGSSDQELLALSHSLHTFYSYIWLKPVVVNSDNIALKFFSKVRNASLRLNKLAVSINGFNIEIRFLRRRYT